MKFLRWIGGRVVATRRRKGESLNDVYQLLQEAHAHLRLEEYDKARAVLLRVIGSRDTISEPETISYILMSLAATWLLTEQYEDGIAFFSEYLSRERDTNRALNALKNDALPGAALLQVQS